MSIPIFLSCPRPFLNIQREFRNKISDDLKKRGLEPKTLGVTDYDVRPIMEAVYELMSNCDGVLMIALRREYIENGKYMPDSDVGMETRLIKDKWKTSPWCQIEASMAYVMDLPLLIFREEGVMQEGTLDKGVIQSYVERFDLIQSMDDFLESEAWKQLVDKWETNVRKKAGCPKK